MLRRWGALTIVWFMLSGFLSPCAQAARFFERPPNEKPDVLSYGWRGLFLGALTGLGAGYVRYGDANSSAVLQSLAYGTVIGAGAGIIAGLNDASLGYRSTGDILLRDMTLGGWFGLVVGSVWGGVNAISQSNLSALGSGAAWGYIGGVVTGLGIGIYESSLGYNTPSAASATPVRAAAKKNDSAAYVTFFVDSRKNRCPALAFTKRFQ